MKMATATKTRQFKVVKFTGKTITKSDYIHNYEMENDHNEIMTYGFGQISYYTPSDYSNETETVSNYDDDGYIDAGDAF